MSNSQHSYKQIVKSTALFGGVQIVQILTTIVRGKLVAVFLGTTGLGINALLNSAITLIVQFCSLGINFSAVRDISQAAATEDKSRLSYIIHIFRRWMASCAIIAIAITCLCSHQLSLFSFNNTNYTITFVFSSIAVFFTILNNANLTILQGKRQLKEIARVSLGSAIGGLVLCFPCYYFLKLEGILPALIAYAAVSFFLSFYYSRKATVPHPAISFRETYAGGTKMAKLGITMLIATLTGTTATYLINAYIGKHGSVSDVGLYSAGISLTNQYIGIVFTAMAVDYFPKLSAVCHDTEKVNEIVNKQSEIIVLISGPLLITMMISAPILIKVLLSAKFLVLTQFIYWSALAMFFKAASFATGYISFAKGDKKTFLFFEGILGASLYLISNIAGYKFGGIIGMAKATLISYVFYIVAVNVVTYYRYSYRIQKEFVVMFIKLTVLLTATLCAMLMLKPLYAYMTGVLMLIITASFAYTELNKRIAIKEMILSRFKK